MIRYFLTLLLILISSTGYCLDAIPDLKVFGGDTRGAFGNSTNPTIYIVDSLTVSASLENDTRNGVDVKTGGIDAILEDSENNKLILFEISGNSNGSSYSTVYCTENYVTIAGQTAPTPGIVFRNYQIAISGHDWVVQHLKIRMDDGPTGTTYTSRKGMQVVEYPGGPYPNNVVVDHCEFIWGIDGAGISFGSTNAYNISVTNSIIGEGLNNSFHNVGEHGFGTLIVGGDNLMLANNMFISNYERNPYFTTNDNVPITMLIANNFIYNAGNLNLHFGDRITVDKFDIISNVTEGGPSSNTYGEDYICSRMEDLNDDTEIYFYDNRCDYDGGYVQANANDWTRVRDVSPLTDNEDECKSGTETFTHPTGYTPMASSAVKAYVLANVGARPGDRPALGTTQRLIDDATNDTGDIVDTVLYTNANCVGLDDPMHCCTGSGSGSCDQVDELGFPSISSNTTTFKMPATPFADTDGDGYRDIEEVLHDYAAVAEGRSISPQGVSPGDGDTGVSTTADGSWYTSFYVDSMDWYLYANTCDNVTHGDGGSVASGDDDTDYSMDFGTLSEDTTYCLTMRANYDDVNESPTQGDAVEYEFSTTDEIPPTTNLAPAEVRPGGAPAEISPGSADAVVGG